LITSGAKGRKGDYALHATMPSYHAADRKIRITTNAAKFSPKIVDFSLGRPSFASNEGWAAPNQRFFTPRKEENRMFEGLFQPMHLLVIFGIALLVFGPKKLPELGKGIGDGIRGFKEAMNPRDESAKVSTVISDDTIPR
jgi:sec-independent protein translocase protein TatA